MGATVVFMGMLGITGCGMGAGGGAIGIGCVGAAGIGAGIAAFMNQVGFGTDGAYIGVLPKFLAVPTDLWETGQILVGPTLYESNMPGGQASWRPIMQRSPR